MLPRAIRFFWIVSSLCVGACREQTTSLQNQPHTAHGPTPAHRVSPPLNVASIAENLGTEVKPAEDGVLRATWPRTEVKVSVDGIHFSPPAGLTSWIAFMPAHEGAMAMGDTVVFEDEVNPAIDAAFAHHLEVTALHNHFFYDEPKVYFMHIGGMGASEELARGVKAVWEAIRQVRKAAPQPAKTFGGSTPVSGGAIEARALEKIVGEPSATSQGVVKITIARRASMHGLSFGAPMGLTTWAAFSGNDELAAMDGDFAMTAAEVQPVLRALRRAEISIVALHNRLRQVADRASRVSRSWDSRFSPDHRFNRLATALISCNTTAAFLRVVEFYRQLTRTA